MLIAILNTCNKKELEEENEKENEANRLVLVNKIRAIGRLQNYFNTLRKDSETVSELKSVMGVEKLPPGFLHLGSIGIKEGIFNLCSNQII